MADHEPTRSAILEVSPQIVAHLLQLPSGCHIDACWVPWDRPGVLCLRVLGAGWIRVDGERIPTAIGQATRTAGTPEDDVVTIDWGLPHPVGE